MATIIKLKRGTSTPTTGDITSGEIAVDTSAQKLYINDSGTVKSIGDTSLSDLSITSTAAELNHLDGVTGITLGTANELLVVGGDGSSIISDSTLAVDTGNNYIGINQSSPEVTLHMTGEGAQTAQIRMEQYNDSADAPDIRTRRYRGTIASPSAISSGDYLYRSNHEYWNGSALIVGGSFAFDNTNNANRTQFAVSVTTDGTSADPNNASKTQFKIDGNDSGAITFNNAYKFPTSDGSANQVLQTNGSGILSFASVSAGGISGITVQEEGSSLTTAATTLNFVGSNVTATGDGVTKTITITGNDLTAVDSNIVPDTDRTYDLGTITNAFKDLFLNDNVKQKVNVFTSSGGLVTPVTNFTFKLSNRQIFENVFTAAGGLVTSAINNTVFDDNNPAYRF
jgi:hypothetical protein